MNFTMVAIVTVRPVTLSDGKWTKRWLQHMLTKIMIASNISSCFTSKLYLQERLHWQNNVSVRSRRTTLFYSDCRHLLFTIWLRTHRLCSRKLRNNSIALGLESIRLSTSYYTVAVRWSEMMMSLDTSWASVTSSTNRSCFRRIGQIPRIVSTLRHW